MRKQRERKRLVIDRSKWRSGSFGKNQTGSGITALLNDKGYMCCLGFATRQFSDIKDHHITCTANPAWAVMYASRIQGGSYITDRKGWEKFIIPHLTKFVSMKECVVNTSLSDQAIKINDSVGLTSDEREKKLKALFSKFHIDLTFEGEYNS